MKKLLYFIVFAVALSTTFSQVPYNDNSYHYLFGWQDIYASIPDVPSCNEGALTTAEKEYVLEYINFIRYLHDLKPVVYDYGGDDAAQKAALIQAANGQLSHTPPPTWSCYSQEGYDGSMNSNLHLQWGMGQGAEIDSRSSVIGWMMDNNSQNAEDRCGHRRAIINPFVTAISFGRVDGQGPAGWTMAAALKYMDNIEGNISDQPLEFVAYPYHNYPPDLVDKSWFLSFSPYYDMNNNFGNSNIQYENASVSMTDENDNPIPVSNYSFDYEGWGAVHNNFRWKATGLQNEVKYNVEVKNVVVNGQNRNYSYWFKLTTNVYGLKPETPLLSFPSNNAKNVNTSTSFSWSLPKFSNKFQFQIAKDNNFTNLIKDTITSVNGIMVNNLELSTTYYWHVLAMNDNGSSEWSETFSFTTSAPQPGPPTLAYPPDGTEDVSRDVVLRWHPKSGAERYHIQVSNKSNFSGFSTIDDMHITDTSFAVNSSDLEYDTDYYWHIAAYIGGEKGEFSETWKFRTKKSDPKPEKPTLASPDDGAVDVPLTVVLQWDDVLYAQHYTLKIATDDNFTTSNTVLTQNTDISEFQVPPQLLQKTTKYYWKVQSWNETGISDWSRTFSFTTGTGVGVKEQIITDGIYISPNPVNDYIYLTIRNAIDSKAILSITNLLGEIVFEANMEPSTDNDRYEINTSNLSQGIYFIRINTNNSIYLTKFVKE